MTIIGFPVYVQLYIHLQLVPLPLPCSYSPSIMATWYRISSFILNYIPPPMRDIIQLAATLESSRDMGYRTTSSRCNSIIGSLLIPSLLSGFALLHHGPELEAYEQCCAAKEGC
jgi:hypothetical protein